MGDIVVKVTPELAAALASTDPSVADFHRTLRIHKAKLGPPTGTTGETRYYFLVTGAPPERVDGLLEDLRRQRGVDAAYIKPSDELP